MSFLTAVPIIEKREKEKENEKEKKKDKIKEFNYIEEQYLSYLINKETKYANIEKIEKKYRFLIIEKYNKYNENKLRIEKKKIEYQNIIIDIQQEILNNYIMKNKLLQEYYNKAIEDMTREIKMKNHEQNTYQNMYNRLYKTNIMIKRRIEQEIKLEPVVLNQYYEYNMLKNHALVSLKSEEHMLNNMKKFQDKENEKFIEEKMKKRNTINYLDIQIQLIKKEVKSNEDKINKIKDIEDEIKEKIYEKEKTNKMIKRDIDWNKRDYLKNYIQIMKILFYLKVNSINELIPTFNHIKEEYQGLHTKFSYYNLEISKLNNIFTQQEKKLNDIKLKIKIKKKNKELHNDTLIIRRKESKVREIKFYCNLLLKNINSQFILLQKLIDFMNQYIITFRKDFSFLISEKKIKKFTKLIIADINLTNILEVKKTLLYLSNLFQHFCILLMKCIFFIFNNLNIEYLQNNNIKKNSFLFPLFHSNILEMFNQSIIRAIKQADVKNQIKNEAELLSNLKSNNKNNNNHEKEGISQKELFNQFQEYLYREGIDIENNKKAIQNNNKNIYKFKIDFFKGNINKKISIINKNPSLILNKTMNSFNSTTYSSIFDSSLFLLKHPKQIMKIMEKYQNDLVFPEKENQTFRERRSNSNQLNNKKIILKKKSIDNFNNISYQKNIKKEESNHHSIVGFSEEISDHSSEEYKENERKKKVELKKKMLEENRNKKRSFKDNPEMALIYKRMNDLHFLQLSYLRNKKEFGADEFKEIYFNFQRKYINKNKLKIKSLGKSKIMKQKSRKNNSVDMRKLNNPKLNLSKFKSEELNIKNHSLTNLIKKN